MNCRHSLRSLFSGSFAFVLLAGFFGACAGLAEPADEPYRVYVAPDGDDGADGLAPERAIRSLSRAHEMLAEAAPDREVRIRIAPGRYYGQRVRWSYTDPDHPIVFLPHDPEAEKPVFDGGVPGDDGEIEYPGGTWFVLSHSRGERTNLVFRSLQIENYQTAISFNGNRNNTGAYNAGNRIEGCTFRNIGNIYNPDVRPSTATVRLVNSIENEIRDNDFVDIINTTSPNRMHAIYAAHYARRNVIENNRFIDNAGDPVRLRDFSNDNVIAGNLFRRAGIGAAYSEWYCDHDARDDCTKAEPECPSWNNVFRDNIIETDFDGNPLAEYIFYQGDTTSGCEKPSPDARRLITENNRLVRED